MEKLSYVDNGDPGRPGTSYDKKIARVDRIRPGRYQLSIFAIWGSNQGYEEEHGRIERRYRAETIAELLRVGIAEVRADADLGPEEGALLEAIRQACFEAEDAEAETEADR